MDCVRCFQRVLLLIHLQLPLSDFIPYQEHTEMIIEGF